MRRQIALAVSLLLLLAVNAWPQTVLNGASLLRVRATNLLPMIVDTDYGCDVDDVADLWVAAFLRNQGYLEIVGVVTTGSIADAAPGVRASLDYANLQAVPMGNYPLGTQSCNTYATAVKTQFRPSDSNSNYTASLTQYRAWLANSRGGIIIFAMGQGSALDQLLTSPANSGGDGFPSGATLIATKVAALYWVAGIWPSGSNDFNLTTNGTATAAADVLANWPGPIVMVDLSTGGSAGTGNHAAQPANTTVDGYGCFTGVCSNITTNPFHKAWDAFDAATCCSNPVFGLDVNGMRNAWSPPGLLYLIFGSDLTFGGQNGTCSLNTGTLVNTWTSSAGTCSYLVLGGGSTHSSVQTKLAAYFTGF